MYPALLVVASRIIDKKMVRFPSGSRKHPDINIGSPFCTDLSELICLESVGGDLRMGTLGNTLTNLDGLSALTSVGLRL